MHRHWGSVQVVRPIGGVEVQLYSFLTFFSTRRGEESASRPGHFTPEKDPVPIVQEAGWAPGPVWTGAENLAATGIRSPDRPARSQSLYRLSYRPTDKDVMISKSEIFKNRDKNDVTKTSTLCTPQHVIETRSFRIEKFMLYVLCANNNLTCVIVAVPYRRFRATYPSHLQESRITQKSSVLNNSACNANTRVWRIFN